MTPAQVKTLRERLGLTQNAFARTFAISIQALRNWEQGARSPRGPARSLLIIIDKEPEAAMRALKSASKAKTKGKV